jgi:hypothetical protein
MGVEREVEIVQALQEALVVLEQALALGRPGDDDAFADREVFVAEHEVASTDMRVPRPEHSGQAPNGALNEKVRGSISVSCSGWPFGHDSFSEKCATRSALSSTKLTWTRPSARPSAVSTESVSAAQDRRAGDEAVDDDRDVVLVLLLEDGRLVELDQLAVDDARE